MNVRELRKLLATIPPDVEVHLSVWKGDDPNGTFGHKTVSLGAAKKATIYTESGSSQRAFLLSEEPLPEIVPHFRTAT